MSEAERSNSEIDKQLVEYLLSLQPDRLTIVGEAEHWVLPDTQKAPEIQTFETLAECDPVAEAASEDASSGASVALLYLEGNEHDQEEDTLALELGKAVRLFPDRLVVSIDSPEPADTEFFAFGFRKLHLSEQGTMRLFEYCLSEYKQSPDWLNARYWANPDRFDNDEDSDIYSEDDSDDEE